MYSLSPIWLEILSELFVNLAAGWFALVFIEPRFSSLDTFEMFLVLTAKGSLGILSLLLAKYLREEARKHEQFHKNY